MGFAEEQLESWSGKPWLFAAEKLYERFRVNMGSDTPFIGLPAKERIAWEVIVRHLANVFALQPGADLTEHEAHWIGWAEKHAPKVEE